MNTVLGGHRDGRDRASRAHEAATTDSRPTCGFTLVELLVVIAIIGTLVALLLSSVQSVRESARKIACSNNLRQLGQALHGHVDAMGKLPCMWKYVAKDAATATSIAYGDASWSGNVLLLPYLEQSTLFNNLMAYEKQFQRLPPTGPLYVDRNPHWDRDRVPGFKCPSDATSVSAIRNNNYMFNMGDKYFGEGFLHADFRADPPITTRARGPFASFISLRLKDITDGTSKTIAMAETVATRAGVDLTAQGFTVYGSWPANDRAAAVRVDATNPSGCWARWNGLGFSSGQLLEAGRSPGAAWLFGRPNLVGFNTVMPPNGPTCTNETGSGMHTARSYHPGGVAVVMLDASVRFVSEAIDSGTRTTERTHINSGVSPYGVWGALGTRASSEQFSNDF